MKVSKFRDMERMVGDAAAGSVLLVAGPDLYQSGRLEKSMTDRYREDLSWEVIRLEGSDLGRGDLKRMLHENSLFSEGRLLVVSQTNRLSPSVGGELLDGEVRPVGRVGDAL